MLITKYEDFLKEGNSGAYRRMYTETIGTINFAKPSQKALWDHEITGQLSDGHWENTNPQHHWEFWAHLQSKLDPSNVGVFKSEKYKYERPVMMYNLLSKELLDVVGDRMIDFAKMAIAGGNDDAIHIAEYSRNRAGKYLSWQEFINFLNNDNYFKKYANSVNEDLYNRFLAVEYDKKDLNSDLKAIKAVMETAKNVREPGQSAWVSASDKDRERVKNIIDRAKGDYDKEVALAMTMAKAIADGKKAAARSTAAKSLNKPNIAKVFADRARELGAPVNENALLGFKKALSFDRRFNSVQEAHNYLHNAIVRYCKNKKGLTVSGADGGGIKVDRSGISDVVYKITNLDTRKQVITVQVIHDWMSVKSETITSDCDSVKGKVLANLKNVFKL